MYYCTIFNIFKFLEIFFPETLPEKVTLSSSGPAGDILPRAMGVYSKLSGLTPVWENSINNEFKLFYDGKKYEEYELHTILYTIILIRHKMDYQLHC